ncbi:NADH-ubiquinone dehydrogenase [Hoeflea sp. AS60]|uniref:NADH-ubiquinone dehydrogenase n=1 Tax=Hoeflea sp. AS60 TaxID=3135780 RepID=UPI00316E6AF8
MSMFSFPADMNTNEMMRSMTAMTDWTKAGDLNVSPLMVYPLGAAAAATAVGFGIAGQMAGMMMGAMQGAMQSQTSVLGQNPDFSWMMPTLTKPLAPEEDDVETVAVAEPVVRSKSAEIVELKPAAKPATQKAKAKVAPVKRAKPKATPAKAEKAAEPVNTATGAAVEKLKSDAEVAAAVASETAPVSDGAPVANVAELAPEDFRRPAEIEKPGTPDDLKLISGVGPKLEQVLNGLGVWTFAQIAGWQPEEAAWVDDYLQFSGRIGRDDWISQASALAKGGATAE